MSEHGARALHVGFKELRSCDQTGLLCRRQTGGLGFGARCGAAIDARQILRKNNEGRTLNEFIITVWCFIYEHSYNKSIGVLEASFKTLIIDRTFRSVCGK